MITNIKNHWLTGIAIACLGVAIFKHNIGLYAMFGFVGIVAFKGTQFIRKFEQRRKFRSYAKEVAVIVLSYKTELPERLMALNTHYGKDSPDIIYRVDNCAKANADSPFEFYCDFVVEAFTRLNPHILNKEEVIAVRDLSWREGFNFVQAAVYKQADAA